jgi:hypothetical protein
MSIQSLTSTIRTLGKLAFVFSLSFGLLACTAQSGQNTRPSQGNTTINIYEAQSRTEPSDEIIESSSGAVNDMRSGSEPVNDMRFDDVVEEDAPVKRGAPVNDMRY